MNTSEVLNKAADMIEQRGWTQKSRGWNSAFAQEAPLCLEGGIQAAMGMTFEDGISNLRDCPAYQAVSEYLDARYLFFYNDDPSRTAEEVIAVLRAAAVVEATKESELVNA